MGRFREKLSVTVPTELIADLERAVRRRRYPSRSAAVAAALTRWARAERESEWDEYYRSTSDEERREERDWAELGYESFVRGEPEQRARRRRRR